MPKFYQFAAVAAAVSVLGLLGCGRGKSVPPIMVGSQSGTAQMVVGEIVAQHLEHRLARKIERRPGLGNEQISYQALQAGEISLFPAFTGSLVSVILQEQPSADPGVVWERSHTELSRTAQMELFNPLGYENPPAMAVRAADAREAQSHDAQPGRGSEDALEDRRELRISAAHRRDSRDQQLPSSHGPVHSRHGADQAVPGAGAWRRKHDRRRLHRRTPDLAGLPILADDRHAFPPYQACLLMRMHVLAAEPRLHAALTELSGKFSTE